MTLQTNLNQSPYFDDYDVNDQYYQYLFQANTSVQIRELNGLQSMLQKQIELFGDNILEQGTILSGCNFSFLSTYPYVKLTDVDINGFPTIPANTVGFFATSASSNLQAFIINYQDGFESTDPNLKTIYVRYLNSGSSGTQTAFNPGDVLTITDANNALFNVVAAGGGINFSNTDSLVVVPTIAVNVSSGSFTNGAFLVDPTSQCNVQIVNINTTALAVSGQLLLTLAPRTVDLANGQANSLNWLFANAIAIRDPGSTMAGTIMNIYGEGATGVVTTDGAGRVNQISLTSGGGGYIYTPFASVRSVNNTTGYTSLNLLPQNYLAQLKVWNGSNPVGSGYAFNISDGVIYQKGYFLEADNQTVIIDKYDQGPNNVGVAFQTTEQIVNYNIDPNLLDNALGSPNDTAPGADRLKLIPQLVLINSTFNNASNASILPLVEWSEGQPFLQNQGTQYSVIEQEMAQRTYDEAGNFILAPFQLTTRAPLNANTTSNTFSVIVSPGTAYISGEKTTTVRNFTMDAPTGLDSTVTNNYLMSLAYGNYIRVTQCAGLFQYSTGDTVTFYDTAVGYTSNATLAAAEVITPVGNIIGTARIRSMDLESGVPATNTAIYRLYLFNMNLTQGKNFFNAASVYYNGNYPGIADIVTEQNATSGANGAIIHEANSSYLVFYTGPTTVKNSNNTNYSYRTVDQTVQTVNTGILTKSISTSPTDFYPFATGNLTSLDLQSLYVVPLGNNISSSVGLAGTIAAVSTSTNAVGTGTTFQSNLTSNLVAGDWVFVAANSAGGQQLNQISSVSNDTFLSFVFPVPFTNSVSKVFRTFPKYLPVPFGTRAGLSGNVDATQQILSLNFGVTSNASTTTNTAVGVSINRFGVSPANKSAVRGNYVMLCLANNAGGTTGPWCMGVADVIRLNGVWIGNSSVTATGYNYLTDFAININQNPDFVGLAYLNQNSQSPVSLTSANYILVQFDYLTSAAPSFYNSVSYVSSNTAQQTATDCLPVANLGSSINTWEVPSFYDASGNYYDLLQWFDFRPIVNNNVTPASTVGAAPINPNSAISFGNTANPSNDKHFPLPGSVLTTTIEQYAGRIDSLYLSKTSQMFMYKGVPVVDPAKRKSIPPKSSMVKLADFNIPAYPSFPSNMGLNTSQVMNTNITSLATSIGSSRFSFQKIGIIPSTATPRGYTMTDFQSFSNRLSALEYYTSLNSLESDLSQRIIPSSVDGTLNRFKYGIFVDSFANTMNSALNNPEYAATIDQNRAYPKRISWSVSGPPGQSSPPNVPVIFINQNTATGNINSNCVISTNSTTLGFSFGKSDLVNCQQPLQFVAAATGGGPVLGVSPDWGAIVEYFDVTATQLTGGQCYFHFFNDVNNPCRYHIYRENLDGVTETLVATSDSAVTMDAVVDLAFFTKYPPVRNWFKPYFKFPLVPADTLNFVAGGGGLGQFCYGAGKILFTHTPSLGLKYRCRVFRGKGAQLWEASVAVPASTSTTACPSTPNTPHTTFTGVGICGPIIGSVWDIVTTNFDLVPSSFSGGDYITGLVQATFVNFSWNGPGNLLSYSEGIALNNQAFANPSNSVPGGLMFTPQPEVGFGLASGTTLGLSGMIDPTTFFTSTLASILPIVEGANTLINLGLPILASYAYSPTIDTPIQIGGGASPVLNYNPLLNPQNCFINDQRLPINQPPNGSTYNVLITQLQPIICTFRGMMPNTQHGVYMDGILIGYCITGVDGIVYLNFNWCPQYGMGFFAKVIEVSFGSASHAQILLTS